MQRENDDDDDGGECFTPSQDFLAAHFGPLDHRREKELCCSMNI